MYCLVANWKMNLLRRESFALVSQIQKFLSSNHAKGELVVCPSFTLLESVSANLDHNLIKLGAQDCSEHVSGAYTGDVSVSMLRDLECEYVILGHSERRTTHQETSDLVKRKAELASHSGITPIICVGESLETKKNGQTFQWIEQQLLESIPDQIKECIIAYEPVWAIGSGMTPSLVEIDEVGRFISKIIDDKFLFTKRPKILYGGSVNDANCAEIVGLEFVNGLLVGGASLSASKFIQIIATCNAIKKTEVR